MNAASSTLSKPGYAARAYSSTVSTLVGSGWTTTHAGSWYDSAGLYGSDCSTVECEDRTSPFSSL